MFHVIAPNNTYCRPTCTLPKFAHLNMISCYWNPGLCPYYFHRFWLIRAHKSDMSLLSTVIWLHACPSPHDLIPISIVKPKCYVSHDIFSGIILQANSGWSSALFTQNTSQPVIRQIAFFCFGFIWNWSFIHILHGTLHWHEGDLTIVPMPME